MDFVNEEKIVKERMSKKNIGYTLIHTLDITCNSCVYEVDKSKKFVDDVMKRYNISFIVIGHSFYKETKSGFVSFDYPFYFDFERKFETRNHLLHDDITKSFLIKEDKVILVGDLTNISFKKKVLRYLAE